MAHRVNFDNVLDKRQDPRVRCTSPVQVAMRTDDLPAIGELQDISVTGLRLRVNQSLALGQDYPIYVGPAAGHDGVLLSAYPVWVEARADGRDFEVGCRFSPGTVMPTWFQALQHLQQRRTIRLSGTFDTILTTGPKTKLRAVTHDLSISGAGVHSTRPLALGTLVDAQIDFVSHGRLKATAEVVYCQQVPQDLAGYKLGLSFGPMKERQARRLALVLEELRSRR